LNIPGPGLRQKTGDQGADLAGAEDQNLEHGKTSLGPQSITP
jgi:hypothetical protein